MDYLLQQMTEMFRGLTPETLVQKANFKLSVFLIRDLAAAINVTHEYAAGIVGQMEIQVSDEAFNENPEGFYDLARELTRVLGVMFDAYTKEFDHKTAHAFVKSAASSMSLTYK